VTVTAKAFAPGAISSFFAIRDAEDGNPLADPMQLGAVGGGFGLEKGVHTQVTVKQAPKNSINIQINGQGAHAKTTKQVIETLLQKTDAKYEVTVDHQIDVPIGMGFGTSAGGALTAALALCKAIELPLTYNQIGAVAH
jgi:pantoate kinase